MKLSFTDAIIELLVIYMGCALPSEFLFRGIIQNLIHNYFDMRAVVKKYMTDDDVNLRLPTQQHVNDELLPSYSSRTKSYGIKDSSQREPLLDQEMHTPSVQDSYRVGVISSPLDSPELKDVIHIPISVDEVIDQPWHYRQRLILKRTCWCWFWNLRDWVALVLGALIFALACLLNTIFGTVECQNCSPQLVFIMAFFGGLITGWTWRQTSKVTVACLVYTFAVFFGHEIFHFTIQKNMG